MPPEVEEAPIQDVRPDRQDQGALSALDLLADYQAVVPDATLSMPLRQQEQSLDFTSGPDIYAQAQTGDSVLTAQSVPPTDQTSGAAFISEKLDENVAKLVERTGVSPETAERVLREINQFGENPMDASTRLMRENRVLGLGESHTTPNPQRDFGIEAMDDLRRAGATHLAIEAPMRIQPALDEYMRTGKLDRSVLPPLLRDADYLKMLEAARTSGMKIVAVDANRPYNEGNGTSPQDPRGSEHEPRVNRDELMASNIDKILKEDEKNKVVFWVGSRHLDRGREGAIYKGAGDILRENYKIATVNPIEGDTRGMGIYPLDEITAGLNRPVAVSTARATNLGDLLQSKFSADFERQKAWDYQFIYPSRRR